VAGGRVSRQVAIPHVGMSRSRPEERTRPALLEVHGSEEMALIFELSACCMLSTVLSIRDSMGSKTNPVLAYSLKREIDIIKKNCTGKSKSPSLQSDQKEKLHMLWE
jgi:hypothetical protein